MDYCFGRLLATLPRKADQLRVDRTGSGPRPASYPRFPRCRIRSRIGSKDGVLVEFGSASSSAMCCRLQEAMATSSRPSPGHVLKFCGDRMQEIGRARPRSNPTQMSRVGKLPLNSKALPDSRLGRLAV